MPDKNGIELVQDLKRSPNSGIDRIPIIMITVDTKEKPY